MSKALKIIETLQGIREMSPRFIDFELPLSNLSEIRQVSKNALMRSYEYIDSFGNLTIYHNKISGAFVVGRFNEDDLDSFLVYLVIDKNEDKSPVIPKNLNKLYQIGYVQVKDTQASAGIAKATYLTLLKHFDITSDTTQFLGGYWLWKSLVKESVKNSKFNIYIYNGNTDDYFKDSSGKPIKYNGSNIAEDEIWGKSDYHEKIVLVATSKRLG